MSGKALLLVGSPKGFRSASGRLGDYLMRQMAAQSWQTEQLWVRASWENPGDLTDAVEAADLVVLSAPLYVDGPPGPVMRAMEIVARHRRREAGKTGAVGARPAFVALLQSGYPEAYQSNTALAIYRRFAAEAGLTWAGGLAMGGGPIVWADRPLEESGDLLQGPREALAMAARALAAGQSVPQEAIDLLAQTPVPSVLYRAMGQKPWVKAATKAGISLRQMFARPYEPARPRRVVDLADLTQLELKAQTAEAVTWQGRRALRLEGLALLGDLAVAEGVVELDLGADPGGCYPGLAFHAADPENYELIYCQPHCSGQWDALQYDPVFRDTNTWQVFNGPDYQGEAEVPTGCWLTLRVELSAAGATARLLRAGEIVAWDAGPASLVIDRLAHSDGRGRLGVWTYQPAYFAQLRIYGLQRGAGATAGAGAGAKALPPGTVTTWHLEGHGPVTVEPNGTLCLNRYIRQNDQSQAVLRHEFETAHGSAVALAFGFSDDLKLLVDGREVFAGEHRFQGFADRQARGYIEPDTHVVPLALEPGRHTLTAVLAAAEPFGWGITLAIRESGARA